MEERSIGERVCFAGEAKFRNCSMDFDTMSEAQQHERDCKKQCDEEAKSIGKMLGVKYKKVTKK